MPDSNEQKNSSPIPETVYTLIEKGHRFGLDLDMFWSCFGFDLESIWSCFGSELGQQFTFYVPPE